MPRGSLPGERRGGRKKGTPNKSTLDRQRVEEERIKALEDAGVISTPSRPVARMTANAVHIVKSAKGRLLVTVGDEQIERMTMRDIMEWVARRMMKDGLYWEAGRIAAAAAPYGHARLSRVIMDASIRRDARDFSDSELVALTISGAGGSEDGVDEEAERSHEPVGVHDLHQV